MIGLSIPIYSNIEQRINHDLELNEELKKYTQDLPKMLDSVTRLDSIEAYDGEVYYKNSILLDDDTKMDYAKVKQIVKKASTFNFREAIFEECLQKMYSNLQNMANIFIFFSLKFNLSRNIDDIIIIGII